MTGRAYWARTMPTLPLLLLSALTITGALTETERRQVVAGEVLVSTVESDAGLQGVRGAIRIAAPIWRVYAVMTSCDEALRFVPRLEVCRVLDSAPDGSYQIIEQVVRPRWFLPRVRFVFRADYTPPREVRVHNVSGDLREHDAEWSLEPLDDGAATLVVYRVHVVPRYLVPQWLILSTLKRDLPAMLRALAQRCVSSP